MSPKKNVEGPKEAAECILRFGKYNNIIQWRDALEVSVCGLYGLSGQFLITNERYVPPMPRELDYVPVNPPVEEGEAPYPPVTAASIIAHSMNEVSNLVARRIASTSVAGYMSRSVCCLALIRYIL